MNKKLNDKLIDIYQNMDEAVYEDDSKWTKEELAGYFLYNCSEYELFHEEFTNIKNECEARQQAWKLIKKVYFPKSILCR